MGSVWRTAREGTKSLARVTAGAPLTPPAPAATPGTSSPPPGDPSETTFTSKLHSVSRTPTSRFYLPTQSSAWIWESLDNGPELPFVGNWELCRVLQDCGPDCRQGGRGGRGRGRHGRRPKDGRDNTLYQVSYQNTFLLNLSLKI